MKTITLVTMMVILSIPIQIFSQANDELESRPDYLLLERIIPHSISDERIKHLIQSNIFKEGESRILINKTILENGFLLTEELWQEWDDSNWVNDRMYTYTYDGNNNVIERLMKRRLIALQRHRNS